MEGWKHVYSGKVRDIYVPENTPDDKNPKQLLMVASDRISAYDFVLPTEIPGKGKVLNQLTLWWFDQFSDVIPNHVLSTDVPAEVAGRGVICKSLDMAPIECVARGYLTGSGLAEYKADQSVCGISLPPGLVEASRLPEAIFTPAAKAELGEHDENITFERAVTMVGHELASKLREATLALYRRGAEIALGRGVIIADTKFEFGIDPATGDLTLADEVLTPDSSRFWPEDEWVEGQVTPSFDKQFVRDWLTSPASGWDKTSGEQPPALPEDVVAATSDRYIEAFERLTGTKPEL